MSCHSALTSSHKPWTAKGVIQNVQSGYNDVSQQREVLKQPAQSRCVSAHLRQDIRAARGIVPAHRGGDQVSSVIDTTVKDTVQEDRLLRRRRRPACPQ